MFCPSCGTQNERDAETCKNCGKPLPRLTDTGELAPAIPGAAPVSSTVTSPVGATGANGGEPIPGTEGPKAGSPGSQYSYSIPPNGNGYNTPYAGYNYAPGYAPYYNYSLPVDRVGVAPHEVGFWARLGAYVIDNIILSIISFVVFVIPVFVFAVSFFNRHQTELLSSCDNSAYGYSEKVCQQTIQNILTTDGEASGFVFMFLGLSVLTAIINVLYYSIMTARSGATVGKKVFGMRVVTADGGPVSFGRALLRHTVGYFVSGVVFGLGFLWIGFDPHKQGWHDKVAGTYVVRSN